MIDRTDRQYVTLRGQRHPLTFNLTKEIELVDSVGCPGIQLTDVVSGVGIYLLRNGNEPDVREWMRIYEGKIHPGSMFPDFDVVDLQQKEAWLKAVVLVELAERARKGTNPLSGRASFYAAARGSIYQTGRFWKAEDDAKRTGSVSPF